MEDIVLRRALDSLRQPQVRHQLMTSPINGGYSSKRRSMNKTDPAPCGIHVIRLYPVPSHLRFELVEIELGRHRLAGPDRVTLAVDDLLLEVSTVDFVVDLVIFAGEQGDRDLLTFGGYNRMRPDGIAQLQNGPVRPRWARLLDRRSGYFETRHSRQDLLQRATIREDKMVFEKELIAGES